MANEQGSSLSFSIQEAVWLNRGQEIDSVMSLELEPEIAIEEAEEHVTVKGNLILSGEYRPGKEVDAEQQQRNASLSEQVSFRSIEDVRISEEGYGTIRHPFPIDVTIPRSRISNLDDVYVNVESFDYDLPGNGCIELQADIEISGMRGEFSAAGKDDDEEEEYVEQVVTEDDLEEDDRAFHFEGYRQPEWQQPAAKEMDQAEHAVRNNPDWSEPQAEAQQEEPDYDQDNEHEPLLTIRGNEDMYGYQQQSDSTGHEESEDLYAMRYEEEEQEDHEEPAQEKQTRDENALYLTKMLAQNDDGQEFSRLRMCIVQAGESIETIADRYKLQVSHLMRTNNLNEERVEEGQILYIPSRKTSSASS
ncbi:stage VI sporulation protein D [Alteribacter lacisalsi]|uniref:Stage VI sporulation protein D n=1 Tax=Alteribacter lacisalsi TaxID=2045244 RepID=A0A2W0H8T0_9BACI|nr:stage VI sporulation protein D [Alteribacter lacisalsi]PYZ97321.1 stage VI sporulation protein D [Alteribacter lacisalsi]